MKTIAAAAAAMSLLGCATVMNDVNNPVRVDTKTVAGVLVPGADCTATNDHGTTRFKSGVRQS